MEFEHVTFDLPHGTFHALRPGMLAATRRLVKWSGKPEGCRFAIISANV